ncbi:unnamed protein product [Haemonchus placei]|uniref:PK_Tyr_Ser-Thr domain-containing protein n=1 Tax=Haemonchus placei TaxID=6290 RepID=A0A0N4WIE2_HAEPC|nr:unnamed protein product [Haemonchus placei]
METSLAPARGSRRSTIVGEIWCSLSEHINWVKRNTEHLACPQAICLGVLLYEITSSHRVFAQKPIIFDALYSNWIYSRTISNECRQFYVKNDCH